DRFSLMGIYGAKLRIGARQTLAGRTEINVGKDGVISISVDDRSPQRAADLANGYVEEFEALTRELAVDPERKREEFLANQVKAAGLQFANAEQALRKTQEKTGLVLFDPQTTGLIEAAAAMRARVAAQEVVVQWMRSFAAQENPALARATQQLAALRDQESKLETGDGGRSGASVTLGQIPGASLEYERKLREVKFREDLFRLLTQQMEAAKLNVTRTDLMVQPSVHLLDRAVAPEEKSSPHRFLIVLSVTALAMLLAVVAASVMEKVERVKWARKPPARVQLYTFHRQEEAEDTRKTG
ncbi:MAG TPA: chain length determinant family protein, partial [Candidatus Angelobacter sp.]